MYRELKSRLGNADITHIVEQSEAALADAGVSRQNSLRSTILLEELLLRYQERFGEDRALSFSIDRRFGSLRLRIALEGEAFNALDVTIADDDLADGYDLLTYLLGGELEAPSYGYRRGRNVVTIGVRLQKRHTFLANPLLIATIVAVCSFFALSRLAPGLTTAITDDFVSPVISVLMGVLSAITGPLLSLSLISGICALGDISTLRSTGGHAMGRIACWVLTMTVMTMLCCRLVFDVAGAAATTAFDAGELFELLLASIPQNLFAPFVEGNALQIAVESIFVGICLLALGERASSVRQVLSELNDLSFKMMHLFSQALPLLVGLSVFKVLVTTDVSSLARMGTIVALNFAVMAAFAIAALAWVSLSLHVSVPTFLKKASPALIICLTTGSTTSAMSDFFRISKKEFGVDDSIVDFWVPLGHAMFTPSTIVPLVVGMYAVADMADVAFGPTRMAVLALLVFQLSITTPKVPGGIAATFTILLSQLGLPQDLVGLLMAANVFVCNPSIAFGDLIRFVEICCFAKSEDALDMQKLASAPQEAR